MSSNLPPFPQLTLEYLIPGYTFLSGAISSVLHIDTKPYIRPLLIAGIVYTSGKFIWNTSLGSFRFQC